MAKIPVLIDTREQLPFSFDAEMFTEERATLRTGDYTVRGLEDVIAIERKNLADLVHSVVQDWPRFRRELWRLAAFDHPLIVVEADIGDIFAHRYESDALPASVLGRVNGITLDHGIPVCFWGARPTAIAMVERFLIQAVKKLGG